MINKCLFFALSIYKIAPTIQCASIEDLEHLVSTFEYFIRSSRLAHDAQPAGLPYLNQGLVFNNQCVVEKLWANSPADRAGITLTDHLWSIGKATGDPQEKKDFEKGLSAYANGNNNGPLAPRNSQANGAG